MPPQSRTNRHAIPHKTIALEILVFITLFTMIGHMTISIWEKQVIHNKLSLMKESLTILKVNVPC